MTIDTYVSELVPSSHRGRAYAYNQFFQFLAVPLVALLAWLLVPNMPLGLDGWRWVVLIGSAGAMFIWFIRLSLPESPRWLARRADWRKPSGSSRASGAGSRWKAAENCRRRARRNATKPARASSPRSAAAL